MSLSYFFFLLFFLYPHTIKWDFLFEYMLIGEYFPSNSFSLFDQAMRALVEILSPFSEYLSSNSWTNWWMNATLAPIPINHPPTVNLPFSFNTSISPTPSHWKYQFSANNHNHLNSDERNQTNLVVE